MFVANLNPHSNFSFLANTFGQTEGICYWDKARRRHALAYWESLRSDSFLQVLLPTIKAPYLSPMPLSFSESNFAHGDVIKKKASTVNTRILLLWQQQLLIMPLGALA